MDKLGCVVVQIGDAARAVDQFIKILSSHRKSVPHVWLKRSESVTVRIVIDRIGRFLSRRPTSMLVLACDSHSARMLPALGEAFRQRPFALFAILRTRDSDLLSLVLGSGFKECFLPPLREADVWPRILRQLNLRPIVMPVTDAGSTAILPGFVGRSRTVIEALDKLESIVHSDRTLLITGETGTGKEVCARAIHHLSSRRDKPFNPILCATQPNLLENELFGHEPGAYTGAREKSIGMVRQTQGGTLFLDEIDSMDSQAQAMMLRFLDAGEFRPLGSLATKRADVRIIAATNANLRRLIDQNRFRKDIFYRLGRRRIHLPPLRERQGDVELLARHFLRRISKEVGQTGMSFSPEAVMKLAAYAWPGNVRQLQHTIEEAADRLTSGISTIEAHHIDLPSPIDERDSYSAQRRACVERFDRIKLQELLGRFQGNVSQAARHAQMDRRQLARRIQRLGLKIPPPYPSKANGLDPG